MMRKVLLALARDERASPSVEMAMALPIMFALLFGAFELGHYFMSEHAVVKAVRDGARYAARRPEYTGCTPSSDLIEETRNVTRTGQVAAGGTPRLPVWTDPNTITVTAACDTAGTYSTSGIYETYADGATVVTVQAAVPYTSILGQLGLADVSLTLNARSEAAVTGL